MQHECTGQKMGIAHRVLKKCDGWDKFILNSETGEMPVWGGFVIG